MIRLVPPPIDAIDEAAEESVTVAEAARRLGCATSTVRELLERGDLTGHRIGKGDNPRGVRVHAQSVRRYKLRHTLGPARIPANDPVRKQPHAANPGAAAARRWLREQGIM